MSVTQHPETLISNQSVQVWNNEAFDNGESEGSSAIKLSWSNLNTTHLSQSFESKENHCPLHENTTITNTTQTSPIPKPKAPARPETIDSEIEAIEKEITRLSSRLQSLKLEKAKRTAKMVENKPCKIPPLKTPSRRGLSIGPAEIMSNARGLRRGISIGPAEIYSATKSKKELITTPPIPSTTTANRRKSCYWKLQDIDELRVAKEIRGKSFTVSPKSRPKLAPSKLPSNTTISAKKSTKKEDSIIGSIQPKKLFNEGEKSAKKPVKNGRVVPSRYSQINTSGIRKRRSLPENDSNNNEEESKRKRASLAGKKVNTSTTSTSTTTSTASASSNSAMTMTTPVLSVSKRLNVRTMRRRVDESPSPRDSGPAKRVAELVGRKSFFSMDEDDDDEMPVFSFELESNEEEN